MLNKVNKITKKTDTGIPTAMNLKPNRLLYYILNILEREVMNVKLKLDRNMRIIATNQMGQETIFDSSPEIGGENSAPTPMQVFLQSMVACTFMDTLSILRKKRKEVVELKIDVDAERTETHPKVFTHVTMNFTLVSSDAELADLNRSIELSQTTYCSASAMFQRSGCKVDWTAEIKRP